MKASRIIRRSVTREDAALPCDGDRTKVAKQVITLFSIMPIVDSLNGYLIKASFDAIISIGDIYRGIVIVVLFALWSRRMDRTHVLALITAGTCGCLAILVHAFFGSTSASPLAELNDLIQWLFCPLIVFPLVALVGEGAIDRRSLDTMLTNIAWITPLTIVVPYIFGLGYSTYGTSEGFVGYKAFYYATNGVSLLLIGVFAYTLFSLISEFSFRRVVSLVLCGISLVLIGTKSALVMLVLSIFICVFCKYREDMQKLLGGVVIALLVILCVGLLAVQLFGSHLDLLFDRWMYFSRVYSDNILSFLTTGRTDRVPQYANAMLTSGSPVMNFLFGIGDISAEFNICEMDFFDVFFEFGALGFLFLLAFSVYIASPSTKRNTIQEFFFLMIAFILLYSFVVGHVFTNAMSSMVLALFVIGLKVSNREEGVDRRTRERRIDEKTAQQMSERIHDARWRSESPFHNLRESHGRYVKNLAEM